MGSRAEEFRIGWNELREVKILLLKNLLLGDRNRPSCYVVEGELPPLSQRVGLEIRVARDPPNNPEEKPIEHRLLYHV